MRMPEDYAVGQIVKYFEFETHDYRWMFFISQIGPPADKEDFGMRLNNEEENGWGNPDRRLTNPNYILYTDIFV